MSFESKLYDGEHYITDDTDIEAALDTYLKPPEGMSTGYQPEMRAGAPDDYAYGAAAKPFPRELEIDESEWPDRIKEMEERKTRVTDLIALAGLPCKNQASTNYCWMNAPVAALETRRVVQNQEMVILSPASGAAPIKGFRNQGGWGFEALQWLAERGVVPVENWPANAIDRRYYTEENKQLALNYRVDEWWELKPRNLKQLMSCLLRRIPIAVGLNWWRHEVLYVDPLWVNGRAAVRMRNSWGMNWPNAGAAGYSVLQDSKMLPDDAVAPGTVLAT